jgi:Ca2+-binding RTX toxin-like protein
VRSGFLPIRISSATLGDVPRYNAEATKEAHVMRTPRILITLVAMGTVGMILAAVAMAATITGTDRGERLRGTNAGDTIDGNGGRDKIQAFAGDDIVTGGSGGDFIVAGKGVDNVSGGDGWDLILGGSGNDAALNGDAGRDRVHGGDGDDALDGGIHGDLLWGGDGADTTAGGDGNDRIAGGRGNDTSNGGNGNDLIFANLGVDTTDGGAGNDYLWAMARGDVNKDVELDTTGDNLTGGEGDDRFRVRDGEVDQISCGPGNDTAWVDTVDQIDGLPAGQNGSCETVHRTAPKSKDQKRGASQDHDKGARRDNR